MKWRNADMLTCRETHPVSTGVLTSVWSRSGLLTATRLRFVPQDSREREDRRKIDPCLTSDGVHLQTKHMRQA